MYRPYNYVRQMCSHRLRMLTMISKLHLSLSMTQNGEKTHLEHVLYKRDIKNICGPTFLNNLQTSSRNCQIHNHNRVTYIVDNLRESEWRSVQNVQCTGNKN